MRRCCAYKWGVAMLDRWLLARTQPWAERSARACLKAGITPNAMTVAGFAVGLVALPCVIMGWWGAAALAVCLNRLMDGLDGAMARQGQCTSAVGAFLDITLDFFFYSLVPLGFAWHNPALHGTAAATLVFSFVTTGTTFLAFAVLAAQHGLQSRAYPQKGIYYLGGLTEGSETIAVLLAMCLWPSAFNALAYGFAALCLLSAGLRLVWGVQQLRRIDTQQGS